MSEHEAGHPYDLLIVSNDDNFSENKNNHSLQQKVRDVVRANFSGARNYECSEPINHPRSIKHALRPNIGMNLGAWDIGWRLPNNHEHFMFMQDETFIKRSSWLASFLSKLTRETVQTHRSVILGESWNRRWDRPWHEISKLPINYEIKLSTKTGKVSLKRTEFYEKLLERWKIPIPRSGGHLRSLIAFTNRFTLESIGGFRLGHHKEQCIAAEMAMSFATIANSGIVKQISDIPFHYIGHTEWVADAKIATPSP
ncbi:MAG: hypothetical protein FJY58_08435 [Betaproteobacteria bacterium]|nr:hypothetical protein [Betaproteobacteria bacterium]